MHDDELVRELRALRDEVSRLQARVDQSHDEGVTRRRLLRAAPAVVLGGALAAVAGAAPATAADGDPVLQGQENSFSGTTTLTGNGEPPALEVFGEGHIDRLAIGTYPLQGGRSLLVVEPRPDAEADDLVTDPAAVIVGFERSGPDRRQGSPALALSAVGPATALTVALDDGFDDPDGPSGPRDYYPGTGVQVSTGRSTAVDVQVSEPSTNQDAVTIEYAGTSRAFYAISSSPTNINGTVTGVNKGHGIGVWGEQQNDTVSGIGVVGLASRLGRGGQFQGGAAAVRLVPATASTHPTTGKIGDVFVDKGARIWFCTHASSGSTSATWRQVAFV